MAVLTLVTLWAWRSVSVTRCLDALKDQGKFGRREGWKRPAEIHGYEEDAVAKFWAPDMGHGRDKPQT
ncbi:MAG: hypothetical protein ACRD3T_01190 [Terriglobia bacterium]